MVGLVLWWSKCGCLGLSSQLLAAPIFRPVRRTRQARVVVIFSGCFLAGGGWGFRAGLTEPLSGHGALLRGAGGDRACLTGRGWWRGMRAILTE